MDGELIISIVAISHETKRQGHLMIFRHTDTLYSVTYRDKCEVIQVDIDNIAIDIKQQLVRFIDPYLLLSQYQINPPPPPPPVSSSSSSSFSSSDISSISSNNNSPPSSPSSSLSTHTYTKPIKSVSSSLINSYSFLINDRRHLHLFNEAYNECSKITNLILELHSKFRDVYYAGVSKIIKKKKKEDKKNDDDNCLTSLNQETMLNLKKLQDESFNNLIENIQEISSAPHIKKIEEIISNIHHVNNIKKNNNNHSSSSSSSSGISNTSLIQSSSQSSNYPSSSILMQLIRKNKKRSVHCFYCDASSLETSKLFYSHPYVPLNYDQSLIYFCCDCIENWWKYRSNIEKENQLILEGEVNEEICSICSDSPEQIILCSSCPRSYCVTCLQKLFINDPKKLHKIINSEDDENWPCMSCCNKIEEKPLLSRETWKLWKRQDEKMMPKIVKKLECLPPTTTSNIIESSTIDNDLLLKTKSKLKVNHIASNHTIYSIGEKKKSSSFASNLPHPKRQRSDSAISIPDSPLNPSKPNVNKENDIKVEESLLPTSTANDEVYYFAQYVLYLESRQKIIKKKITNKNFTAPTEDNCFLCKDGGDLIECDWKKVFNKDLHCPYAFSSKNNNLVEPNPFHNRKNVKEFIVAPPYSSLSSLEKSKTKNCSCSKVLHTYCLRDLMKLSYSLRQCFESEKTQYLKEKTDEEKEEDKVDYFTHVPPIKQLKENQYEDADENDIWCCPRHFCRKCGRASIQFSCALCPLSYCDSCCNSHYDPVIYTEMTIIDDFEMKKKKERDSFVIGCCETCLVILKRSIARGILNENELTIFPTNNENKIIIKFKSFLADNLIYNYLLKKKILTSSTFIDENIISQGLEKLFQLRYKNPLSLK